MLSMSIVFTSTAAAEADPPPDARTERANLVGKWVVTALTINGEEVPDATLLKAPWIWDVGDTRIVSHRPGAGGNVHDEEIDFALDPSKAPKTVDVTDVDKKETFKGVYEIVDDDVLKLCIPTKPTGDRPTGFDARKGTEWVSIRMVRASLPVTVETPKPRLVLKGHTSSVDALAVSPDGKTIASAAYDVRLWDAATGKQGLQLPVTNASTLAFSPDGKTLAVGARDGKLTTWDVATGKPAVKFEGHTNQITSLAFSPDGKMLASASEDKSLKLWDVATGKLSVNVPYGEAFVMAVAWSPDGKTLAVGISSGFHDTEVALLDAATGKPAGKLPGHYGGVYGLAFSPDGKLLASVGWASIRKLWDVETKKEKVKLRDDASNVITRFSWVRFSPDGKLLATQSGKTNNVCLYDVATGKLIVVFERTRRGSRRAPPRSSRTASRW